MAAASLLAGMESESANTVGQAHSWRSSSNKVLCSFGMSQLLQDVRYYTSPPGSTFFAPLDTILENYDPRASDVSTLQRGDVLEVQGPASSGKTQFLQFIAMTSCLPSSWEVGLTVRGSSRPERVESIAIGGREKNVAVMDCDGRFSIERLYHLVWSHLRRRVQEHAATIPALYSAEASPEYLHIETLKALSRVRIFTPTSSLSLTATLLRWSTMSPTTTELAFLLIDNISFSYWQDRHQLEQEKSRGKHKLPGHKSNMRHILEALNIVRQQFGLVTIITNWAFPSAGGSSSATYPFFRQHLQKPYPSPFETTSDVEYLPRFDPSKPMGQSSATAPLRITHHITLHAPASQPISAHTTLENAVKEEPFRSAEQMDIGSIAYVRIPDVERGDNLGQWELVIRSNVIDGL